MASRKVKFSISIEKLNIQFEGDQETGQDIQTGIQDAIGGLLETQGRVLGIENQRNVVDVTPSIPNKPARRRKRRATNGQTDGQTNGEGSSRTPQHGTIPSLLASLLDERYFEQGRKVTDVREALSNRGHNIRRESLSMALKKLTQEGKLNREKDQQERVFVYTAKR